MLDSDQAALHLPMECNLKAFVKGYFFECKINNAQWIQCNLGNLPLD